MPATANDDDTYMRLERTLGAGIDVVWSMWADANHFRAWYGPTGASIPVAEMDAAVGGQRLVVMEMQGPNGSMRMRFAGEFVEVKPPSRLAYTEYMADDEGKPLSPTEMGMPDGHPETTEVRVDLEEQDGSTRMVLTHIGLASDSPGVSGWVMALDKLDDYLAEFNDQ